MSISRDLYHFVKAAVKSGRYTSASEVVRDALREKCDAARREVERKIEAGLLSVQRGDVVSGDAVFEQIHALRKSRRVR